MNPTQPGPPNMGTQPSTPYGYGTPAQQPAQAAGPAQPAGSAPYGASAQPAGTSPYGAPAQPTQPAGASPYGAPTQPAPSARPVAGYGAPPPPPITPPTQGFSGGVPPYGSQNYGGMPPPPPKKKKTGLIIGICSAVVAVAGIAVALIFLLGGNKAQEEYTAIADKIYALSTPSQIAGYNGELRTFNTANPGVAHSDMLELVKACDTYVNADEDDEDTYIDMLDDLDRLARSDDDGVAECAERLIESVESDYEDYKAYVAPPPPPPDPPPASSTPPVSSTPPATGEELFEDPFYVPDLWADISTTVGPDNEEGFSLTFTNNYSATLDYFQVALFCYDEYGNPLYDEYGENFELVDDRPYPYVGPGETHTPDDNGYWTFQYHSDVAYAIPIIIYAKFDDGSWWDATGGITSEDAGYTPEITEYLLAVGEVIDALALEELG